MWKKRMEDLPVRKIKKYLLRKRIELVKQLLNEGYNQQDIADIFNVYRSTIHRYTDKDSR